MSAPTRRAALALPLVLFAPSLRAHSTRLGAIQIGHAWALPSPPNLTEAMGFVPLLAQGVEDRLVAVSSRRAERMEIRRSDDRGRGVAIDGLRLEANRPIPMRPGGLHLAFLGIDRPFVAGERVPVRLTFRDAGGIDFDFWVETAPYASQPRG